MLLEVFHVSAVLHHIFLFWRLSLVDYNDHRTERSEYLLVMRDMSLRFLTIWNLLLQMAYFSMCICEDVLRTVGAGSKWDRPRDKVFRSLVFPGGCLITTVFWPMYTFDRSLVYPATVDELVPTYLNHMMHTNVLPLVLFEMVLRPHRYLQGGTDLRLLFTCTSIYIFCFMWTYLSRGIWMYPLFYQLNWPCKILFLFVVGYVLPPIYYRIGRLLDSRVWGNNIHQVNGAKMK